MEKSCVTFLLCDLGWYVHKPDVQKKWDDNTLYCRPKVTTSVTIVSLSHVMALCVIGLWLGCICIVHATVRESVTPDSKENK